MPDFGIGKAKGAVKKAAKQAGRRAVGKVRAGAKKAGSQVPGYGEMYVNKDGVKQNKAGRALRDVAKGR